MVAFCNKPLLVFYAGNYQTVAWNMTTLIIRAEVLIGLESLLK